MAKPNKNFELTVGDLDLIEAALRSKKAALSLQAANDDSAVADRENVSQIHDLLGRLHNQKSFYRPKSGVYVGG